MQIADAAARRVGLTSYLAIKCEQFTQGYEQTLEIKRARVTTGSAHCRQLTSTTTHTRFATADQLTIAVRCSIARTRCIVIAQGKCLPMLGGEYFPNYTFGQGIKQGVLRQGVRVRFLRGAKPPNPRAEASSAPTNLVNVVGRGGACLRPGPRPSLQKSDAHPNNPDSLTFRFFIRYTIYTPTQGVWI